MKYRGTRSRPRRALCGDVGRSARTRRDEAGPLETAYSAGRSKRCPGEPERAAADVWIVRAPAPDPLTDRDDDLLTKSVDRSLPTGCFQDRRGCRVVPFKVNILTQRCLISPTTRAASSQQRLEYRWSARNGHEMGRLYGLDQFNKKREIEPFLSIPRSKSIDALLPSLTAARARTPIRCNQNSKAQHLSLLLAAAIILHNPNTPSTHPF